MTALKTWRKAYAASESACPWPGPRPLSIELDGGDPWRFVGRVDETGQFLQAVDEHTLVVLHGPSGSGKSSLLSMGLTPALQQAGYLPLTWSQWEAFDIDDPEGSLARALMTAKKLPREVADLCEAGTSLINALDEVLDGDAVLILDQFEELIRVQGEGIKAALEWLLSVNRVNRTRIVLSLRSEYSFRLTSLMRRARPFSAAYQELGSLTGVEDIKEIITAPNRFGETRIAPDAASRVLAAWTERGASGERSLLYLHATLYALYWQARDRDPERSEITVGDIEAIEAGAPGQGSTLFSAGFGETIRIKLLNCAMACQAVDRVARTPLVAATNEQIRRSVAHLSSGGYKLERSLWDLFTLTNRRELALLAAEPGEAGLGSADMRALVRALALPLELDLLDATRSELLSAAHLEPPPQPYSDRMAELGVRHIPWESDANDDTAGALLGFATWEVLVEQARAFAFALEWLKGASIVRVAPNGGTLTLIHDGFGAALEDWSAQRGVDPSFAISSLTSLEGDQWSWRDASHDEFDGGSAHRYLVNLRWRSCQVTAVFRHVVFVNCDLRGSRFVGCDFEGVSFINCLLDGASFDECMVVGAAPGHDPLPCRDERGRGIRPPESLQDALPEFTVDVGASLAADFLHYRGGSATGELFHSPTSGVGAAPREGPAPRGLSYSVSWAPAEGGLLVLGGRLVSLMFRACAFPVGASMTLAHVAGSSLDFVEQTALDLTVSWSVVRGLSISRPSETRASADVEVRVMAIDCVLADTWLGTDLQGTVDFKDCIVHSMTSVSDPLRTAMDNCAYAHVFGLSSIDPAGAPRRESRELSTSRGSEDSATLAAILDNAARRMAYRSNPGQIEMERRAVALAARRREE